MDRRTFLRTTGVVGAGMGVTLLRGSSLLAAGRRRRVVGGSNTPNADRLGWRLGCQAWTFRLFPLDEAIDKVAALGLGYIESFPGQKLSKGRPGVTFDLNSPADVQETLKKKLAASGVRLKNIGVVPADAVSKDIEKSRKTFEFAKQMGVETIVAEPEEDAFDMLEKLCEEYKINVAIHNHPQPSHYWNPEAVLRVCKGRSKRIGACADTGHWVRSGLKPIECLKKLEGRLITFHFKDVNKASPDAHDVPWGTGVCDVKGMLAEIHRQGVKAVFSIEYEHNWENSMPEIAQSVKYFEQTAAQLVAGG
ncbi:MAG: sugar phosphate isomerase/epimerase [Planctomycetaceae bacterium]|nr:sugar phosphate isomerase/epimerase [Planctomycetaceae bacterium]